MNLFVSGLWPTADYNGMQDFKDKYGGMLRHYDEDLLEAVKGQTEFNLIGHSFGCSAISDLIPKLPKDVKVNTVIFIDAVRYSWLYNPFAWFTPFDIQAQNKISFQKSWGLPPSVEIKGVTSITIPGADHANAPRSEWVASVIDSVLGVK